MVLPPKPPFWYWHCNGLHSSSGNPAALQLRASVHDHEEGGGGDDEGGCSRFLKTYYVPNWCCVPGCVSHAVVPATLYNWLIKLFPFYRYMNRSGKALNFPKAELGFEQFRCVTPEPEYLNTVQTFGVSFSL